MTKELLRARNPGWGQGGLHEADDSLPRKKIIQLEREELDDLFSWKYFGLSGLDKQSKSQETFTVVILQAKLLRKIASGQLTNSCYSSSMKASFEIRKEENLPQRTNFQ